MNATDSQVGTRTSQHSQQPVTRLGVLVSLLDRITVCLFALSAGLLFLIMAMYMNEIVMRYLLNSPTVWSIDIVSFSLAALVSLAAPELARTNGNISITILPDTIKSKSVQRRYKAVLAFVSAIVIGIVCFITTQETLKLYNSNILTVGTFIVPKWWISVFIPIGLFFTSVQYLRHAACEFTLSLADRE